MRVLVSLALLPCFGCDAAFDLVHVTSPGDANPNAITVTFGETGTATYSGVTIDTYIELELSTANHGAAAVLSSDGDSTPRVVLIRFDVSAIPRAARVESASVQLSTATESTSTILATQMLEAWDEGASDGVAGVPNWTQRTVGELWSTPGAAPPSRDTAVLGTIRPASPDTTYELALDSSVVAGWVADPGANFGLALVCESSDGVSFRSRNAVETDKRPLLAVTFVPP